METKNAPDQVFVDQLFQEFGTPGTNEIKIRCSNRYDRAQVLLILRDHGYDLNADGVDRTYHVQPDSGHCSFTYPHVIVNRNMLGCTCRTPDPDWPSAAQFIAFAGQYEQGPADLQLPDLPWLS